MGLDRRAVAERFAALVNMDAAELETWLEGEESRRVGQRTLDGDSVGRASGRRIVAILRTPEPERGEEDYRHMRKTVGFIARHRAQAPVNIVTSRWRWSLMNWGHDPLKEEAPR